MKKLKTMLFVVFMAFVLSAPTVTMAAEEQPDHTLAIAVWLAAVAVVATAGGALVVGSATGIAASEVAWPAVIGAAAAGGSALQQSRK